ncbi:unnamed protein product [Nesidiocoris tenuis]|uniref:Uncharacterized protein n=1 Tax=Nesidiocoris tenuis TaxID=355587 RepID=A0A6H5FXD2_9HEMI|nr:unnamed protein product [Nesidiocoris tenuis]
MCRSRTINQLAQESDDNSTTDPDEYYIGAVSNREEEISGHWKIEGWVRRMHGRVVVNDVGNSSRGPPSPFSRKNVGSRLLRDSRRREGMPQLSANLNTTVIQFTSASNVSLHLDNIHGTKPKAGRIDGGTESSLKTRVLIEKKGKLEHVRTSSSSRGPKFRVLEQESAIKIFCPSAVRRTPYAVRRTPYAVSSKTHRRSGPISKKKKTSV